MSEVPERVYLDAAKAWLRALGYTRDEVSMLAREDANRSYFRAAVESVWRAACCQDSLRSSGTLAAHGERDGGMRREG